MKTTLTDRAVKANSRLAELGIRATRVGLDLVKVHSGGKIGVYDQRGTYRLYDSATDELLTHSMEDLDEVEAEIELFESDKK